MEKHNHLIKFAGLVIAAALTLSACGSDEVTSTVTPGQSGSGGSAVTPPPTDQEAPADGDEPVSSPDLVWERVTSRDDLISLQPAVIDSIVVDDDGQTLLVRYVNAAEPCSGAKVTVTESDSDIEVGLEVGLDPNAAAMTCVAAIFNYEIAVELAAPVGDREVVYADVPPGAAAPGGDVAGDMSRFQGLTFDEAVALAEQEGRTWRLGREDGETFALTEDYNPERVTFEVDAGIVTLAIGG